MDCPKCESIFERVTFNNIEVDRCTHCKGLWFDMLEKEDLTNMAGAESIDIGDDQVGKQFDQLRDINCPNCKHKIIYLFLLQMYNWIPGGSDESENVSTHTAAAATTQ